MRWLLAFVLPLCAYDSSFSTLVREVSEVYHQEWCKELEIAIEKIARVKGSEVSFVELQEGGIDPDYLDAMAIEYYKKHKDAYIATVWPTIDYSYEGMIYDILKEHCIEVAYHKKFTLKNGGPLAVMKSIPEKVPHISKDFHMYFEPGKEIYPLMCFVIRAKDLQSVVEAKRHLRGIVKLDPYCMHINDTHDQGLDLAYKFLNNNSLHFLNHHKPQEFQNFNRLIPLYERFMRRRELPESDLCVDGSCVLSAYGIRDSAMDFDFICTKYGPFGEIFPLDHHNNAWDILGLPIEAVLYNPKQFFYYDRLKFISLEALKEFKLKQGREKDLRDVELINELLTERPFYAVEEEVFPGQWRYSEQNVREKVKRRFAWYNQETSVLDLEEALPVVRAPFGLVLVDGHHDMLRNQLLGGTTIPVKVVADLSHLSREAFWEEGEKRGLVYPYNLQGEKQYPPTKFDELINDPNRYFAAITARKYTPSRDQSTGAEYPLWIKIGKSVPFIEFKIADVLREHGLIYSDDSEEFIERARECLVQNPIEGLWVVPKRIHYKEVQV